MLSVTDLPALNATLNAIAAIFLTLGYICIKTRRIAQHKACMIAAFVTSTLFLISYLTYHAQVGSRPFQGQGSIRIVYFTILITHVILAAAIVPLVLITLTRGLRNQFAKHRAIARWTLPLWMYVSITGVIVYLMLYQM
jgi:putative membrane protein